MSLVIVLSGRDMEVKDPAWLSRTSEDMVKANGRDSEWGGQWWVRARCAGAREGAQPGSVTGERRPSWQQGEKTTSWHVQGTTQYRQDKGHVRNETKEVGRESFLRESHPSCSPTLSIKSQLCRAFKCGRV